MFALALPVLVGIFAGMLAGGHLSSWQRTRVQYTSVASIALAVQLLIFDDPLDRWGVIVQIGPVVYLLSLIVVLFVLLRNARSQSNLTKRLALHAAALGIALNCLVIVANGGYMPRVATDHFASVDQPSEAGRLVNVAPLTSETRLAILGDVLPEPTWLPLPNILSIGDLLLAGGLGCWALCITLESKRSPRRSPRDLVEGPCPGESAPI
jgi:hypothetical protein